MIAWLLRSVVTYEHGASELEALFDLDNSSRLFCTVSRTLFSSGGSVGELSAQNEWSGFVKAAMAQNIL